MSELFFAIAAALALTMVLSLYRVLRGPTLFDRLTGLGLIGTKTLVLLLVVGFWTERIEIYVDIAMSYGLLSFVGTLALARYFEQKGDQA
jgi:multicomponent Na+:H+ antiporter subunit F